MAVVGCAIECVQFGEVETGVWCDHCLLPSAFKATVAAVWGMRVLGFCEGTWCRDCGTTSTEWARQ